LVQPSRVVNLQVKFKAGMIANHRNIARGEV
jgi:hypothetical protein